MKSIRQAFCAIFILFSSYVNLFSQKLHFKRFTNSNAEISSTNIRKIIQDKYGYIWIATQEGVNRFNGQGNTVYTKSAKTQNNLANIDIQDLLEDTLAGIIWILHNKSVSAIQSNNGNILYQSAQYSLDAEDWNMHFCQVKNELWIISHSGVIVYNIKTRLFKTILNSSKAVHELDTDQYKNHIYINNQNLYAILNGFGIYRINHLTKQVEKVETNITDYSRFYLKDCVRVDDSTSILASSDQLFSIVFRHGKSFINPLFGFSYSEVTFINPSIDSLKWPGVPKKESLRSIIDYDSSRYLLLSSEKIYVLRQNNETGWKIADTLAYQDNRIPQAMTSVLKDREQNLWIGYEDGIVIGQIKPPAFDPYYYSVFSKNKTSHVNCILPYSTDRLMVGLAQGLLSINKKDGSIYTIDNSGTYYHLFRGPDERVIVSLVPSGLKSAWLISKSRIGEVVSAVPYLRLLTGNVLRPVYHFFAELKAYATFPIIASTYWNDSTLVLATENGNGILFWDYKHHIVHNITTQSTGIRIKENFINTVYADSAKRLWVLSDNSITIINPDKTFKYLTYPDPVTSDTLSIFFDITEYANHYWLAVYGTGILQLDKNFKIVKTYTAEDGLCNIGIYKLYADSGRIFYTTNKGLGFINIVDGKVYNFFKADGLHGDNFEEASFYAGDHTFYAGGNGGFTQVFPQNIHLNATKPPLYITEVKTVAGQETKDSFTVNLASYRFPPNVQQLTVSFSALNYLNPERTQYFYRIKENNNDWASLGNTSNLNLYRFPPGTYTLQIKAANEAGIESDIKELQLIFLPHWYETIWLKLFIILALAAIFYTLYRYRLSQLKAREAIRRKIASDLHDDLGSTLTSIRIFTDLAIRQNPKDFLLQIKQGIQDAMTATRDMIWVMDRTRNNAAQLLEKISSFAVPLTKAGGIHFNLQAVHGLEQVLLKADEQRDLYLIAKEFITNSLKYAGCNTITLQVEKKYKRVAIRLSDDGKGFDVMTVKRGKGLNNMLLRANAIRYKATLNATGNGTVLQLMPQPKFF